MKNIIAYLIVLILIAILIFAYMAWQKAEEIPDNMMQVKIYLPGNMQEDCSNTREITRLVRKSEAVGTAAINQLLQEPESSVPKNTKLLNLHVENKTAYAEFSQEIQNYGGDSCNAQAIRAQIEKTLMQFPTVDRVEISVPGVVDPLQP